MRVCLLTRGDLFPSDHGAAVKIVQTAEAISRVVGGPVWVVTDDRDAYLRFDGGAVVRVPYSARVRAAQEWPGVRRAGGWAERLCGRLGYPVEEHFLYRPMFDPAWLMRALDVGRREHIDVFQAEFPGYGVPAALAARATRLTGRRALSSIVQHNVEWDRLAEFGHDVAWIQRAERAALSMVDDIIAVSTDDRDRMARSGVDRDAISVIPHGVATDSFRQAHSSGVREQYGIAADAPLIFFHGTLHYWPNTEAIRFLVELVLPQLLVKFPEVRVLVCGQNPPAYYAHPAVVYTGSVEDLPRHIAAADVCVCPILAGGGTRMKLLEYMASSKAIVSTQKGAEGIPYRRDHEMLIADEPGPFADAIARALADSTLRAQLGSNAFRFSQRYDWAEIGAAYVALYRERVRGQDWTDSLREPRSETRDREASATADHHLPSDRRPSKPLTMLLLINRGCNLRCEFCDLWQDHDQMEVSQVLQLVDDAVKIGTKTLVITGGEPFLHPDLFDVVAAARAKGLAVNITTNGTLINRRWDEMIASGVSSLSFSIDGLEATHDDLRGQRGAWRKTMAAIERVVAHGGLSPSVYFTVTNKNVSELVDVFDAVHQAGADFDFWPVNDAEDLYLRSEQERKIFLEAVDHIGSRLPAVAARRAYYEAGLAYHQGEAGPVRCLGLVDQFGVKYTGEFLPCCVWDGSGLVLGNVNQTPLAELWRSEAVRKFREGMFHEGCTAGCFNHSLYEFEQSTGLPARLGAAAPMR